MEQSKRRLLFAALSAAAITMIAGHAQMALADPPHGKGKNKKRDDEGGDAQALVYAGITAEAVRRIMGEVRAPRDDYKPLPPGIRKNLARGKPLPPGIAKRYPPQALIGRLPRHQGYEWVVAGSDLVLVQIATRVVADILIRAFE